MRYVPSREASRILGVHPQTLRTWAREGRINYIRTEGNQRRYDVDSYLGQSSPAQTVCYCRVSSKKQSADLDRQVSFMRERYPAAEIVRDVGSGLNFKRKGLLAILERLHQGDKLRVVVAYRDRLARFGTELIETLLERNGGELVVLNQRDLSPEEELTTDLLAILTVFGARVNGLRRYRKESRKIRLYPDARHRAELRRWFGAARYALQPGRRAAVLRGRSESRQDEGTGRHSADIAALAQERSARGAGWRDLRCLPRDQCREKAQCRACQRQEQGSRQDEDFAHVRFRSRKNPRQTFTVQANCVSDMGIYRSKLGDMRMAEKLPVPESRNICRLSLRYGQYHLSVPYDEKPPPNARTKRGWWL